MKNIELFKMASGNLKRRKSRTLLTVLGIVIGTISIVLMVALGLGMQESVNSNFESLSSVNVIEVTKGDNVSSSTRQSEQQQNGNIQDIDIEFFRSIEGVEVVSPGVSTNIKMTAGKFEATVQVIGIDVEMMDSLGFKVTDGRLLTSQDKTGIVFGVNALEAFKEVSLTDGFKSNIQSIERPMKGGLGGFNNEEETPEDFNVNIFTDRINMSLDMKYSPQAGNSYTMADIFRVEGVGILEEGDMTRDRYAYMDIYVLMDMIEDYNNLMGNDTDNGYEKAYVKVYDIDEINRTASIIESNGYSTFTSGSFIDTMKNTIDTLQVALGAIGAVALIVAAIGITNTMIMAIHERRKEIGVMKVIGATIKDIKRLFLIEAGMIGFIGGVIGIGLSVIFSKLLSSSAFNNATNGMGGGRNITSMFSFSIPVWLIIIGMIFTSLVGIISGYIPAKQAMRSSALEAIRTE